MACTFLPISSFKLGCLTLDRSGGLVAGAVTEANPDGWRDIFWIQAGLHLATTAGLLLFYHPNRRSDYPRMSFKEHFWACDPIGSLMFMASVTCLLLSLNWAAGLYAWSNVHVAAPLGVGLFLFVLFCFYGKLLQLAPQKTVSNFDYRMER